MKVFIIFVFIYSVSAFSRCLEVDSYSLKWTAFKTPLKKGVSGTFDNIKIKTKTLNGSGSNQFNTSIKIKLDSVNSSNKKRDHNLVTAFFDKFTKSKYIDIDILSSSNNLMKTVITMNHITYKVPFHYSYSNQVLKANGVIDLFDFSLMNSLKSLNKKCNSAHQGKTWSDVVIEFSVKLKKCQI